MTVIIDGGAGVTFPDTRQQTNATTNTGGSPLYYAARAWVNFDGSTGTIRASVGVASVTRTGTGRYTVALSPAMPDANYCVIATASWTNASTNVASMSVNQSPAPTTTQVALRANVTSTNEDPDYCNVVIFR
jgi:hypothetical protein